jgi:hypothetical protein
VNVPALGLRINGQWQVGWIPAERIKIDLSHYLCEGFDANHPSCKNQPRNP